MTHKLLLGLAKREAEELACKVALAAGRDAAKRMRLRITDERGTELEAVFMNAYEDAFSKVFRQAYENALSEAEAA